MRRAAIYRDSTFPYTIARKRGLPLDAIAIQLGHESIATTPLYARLADDTYEQEYETMFNPNKLIHRHKGPV